MSYDDVADRILKIIFSAIVLLALFTVSEGNTQQSEGLQHYQNQLRFQCQCDGRNPAT
jgi:hypothetical protein